MKAKPVSPWRAKLIEPTESNVLPMYWLQTMYPDGVTSNLSFEAQDLARPTWGYLDVGPHVFYLSNVIARTLTEQMREE